MNNGRNTPSEDHEGPRPDETLDDQEVAPPADAAERTFAMEQRFMHGLLRALHTADPVTRQTRIESILARIQAPERTIGSRLLRIAATLLLLAGVGWVLFPSRDELPRAEAMVDLALDVLSQQVDRQYEVVISGTYAGKQSGTQPDPRVFRYESRVLFTTRPGRRFMAEGSHLLGQFSAGSDGTEIWYLPSVGQRFVMPWDNAQQGSPLSMFLDVGYLDLHALVASLPETCELRTTGRESEPGPSGRRVVRVEASRLPVHVEARIKDAYMLVEEETGLITRIEVRTVSPGGERSLRFDYRGIVELDGAAYQRPW